LKMTWTETAVQSIFQSSPVQSRLNLQSNRLDLKTLSLGDAYCSTFYCSLLPLFLSYCLGPHCSLGPIVHPFWTLSQVAASVVYKPCLYRRGGLKPDLVLSIQVLLLSPAQLCAFILVYLLSLWIVSRSLETLPPNSLFTSRHSSWDSSSRHYCYH